MEPLQPSKKGHRPKAPTSAYFFFSAKHREELQKSGRSCVYLPTLSKEISRKWRALTPEERAPFYEKSKADQKRYAEERLIYLGKDPNRPKKPLSVFFLWLEEFRMQNKGKFKYTTDLARAGSETWKNLSADVKSQYTEKAAVARLQYNADMNNYTKQRMDAKKAKLPKEILQDVKACGSQRRPLGSANTGKRKAAKDPSRPKRPTSAYFYFLAKQREELEKQGRKITKVADWTKEVSIKWKALSDSERAPFDAKAALDKKRYNAEIGDYKGVKDPNKPKRPMSSYFLWLADFREENKSKFDENKELLKAAGANWKVLTPTEKQPYEKQALVEKAKYEEAMKVYAAGGGAAAKKPKVVPVPVDNGADDDEDDDDDDDDDDEEDDD